MNVTHRKYDDELTYSILDGWNGDFVVERLSFGALNGSPQVELSLSPDDELTDQQEFWNMVGQEIATAINTETGSNLEPISIEAAVNVDTDTTTLTISDTVQLPCGFNKILFYITDGDGSGFEGGWFFESIKENEGGLTLPNSFNCQQALSALGG